jgi:lipopolysaccharide biosynthesis glycosyltransferase
MNEIKIFVGFDRVETACFHVLNHSIMRRTRRRVHVIPIWLRQLEDCFSRLRDPLQSNEFSFSRWLVPWLCGYKGWAIFMDSDMLCLSDIGHLWDMRDEQYAVQCVQHNYTPNGTTKYLDNKQTVYPKKNWSSMMLFNNERCTALTPHYVNQATGLQLHQFKWLENDNLIGNISPHWNYLIGYYPKHMEPKLIHWTDYGPWLEGYQDVDYANEWFAERENMLYVRRS